MAEVEIYVPRWRIAVYEPPPVSSAEQQPWPWLVVVFEGASGMEVDSYPTEAEARTAMIEMTLAHTKAEAEREKQQQSRGNA
jgi:hypothetical protein